MAERSSPISLDKNDFTFVDFRKAFSTHREALKLKILVCGRTGVGKSSLINVLVGQEICTVGGPGEDQDFEEAFSAQTKKVHPVCVKVHDTLLAIFDSPGLQDGTRNEAEYLEDMHKKCSDANLVLYCIDMTTPRWLPSEVKATQLLTEKFGLDFWKKTVLALTKGNMIHPRGARDKIAHNKKVYEVFVRKFQTQLQSQGVPEDVANAIPAVIAGSKSERVLPYISPKAKSNDDFLPELWITCVECISGNARETFVKATRPSRFTFKDRTRVTEEVEQLKREIEDAVQRRRQQEERLQKKMEDMGERHRRDIAKMQEKQCYESCIQVRRSVEHFGTVTHVRMSVHIATPTHRVGYNFSEILADLFDL